MSMREARGTAVVALVLCLAGLPLGAQTIRVVKDIALPGLAALDVTWLTDHSVAIAVGVRGVIAVDLGSGKTSTVIAGGGPREGDDARARAIWAAYRVASRGKMLVTSAPVGVLAWQTGGQLRQTAFADVRDVDLTDERAVIVGIRGAGGRWDDKPGATMWSASLKGGKAYFDTLGSMAEPTQLANCVMLLNAAVTRMPDGNLAVANGATAGIFLHDSRGRMIRSWKTNELGFHDRCTVSTEQGMAMAGDAVLRFEWLNRRDTLEDILATQAGPLLIVRHPAGKQTSWRAIQLRYDGKPTPVALPVSFPSPTALLRGAARGQKIALVIYEFHLKRGHPPAQASRLIIAELEPKK